MTRVRLWLLAAAPIVAVAVVAAQLLVFPAAATATGVRGFSSCDELHEHYVTLALAAAQGDYYEDWEEEEAFVDEAMDEAMADGDDSGASTSSGERAPSAELAITEEAAVDDEGSVSETGTNIQERGVDESDIIKTDGEHVYILRPQSLLIAEVSADGPLTAVGRIDFSKYAHRQELLISAGKAVVVRQLSGVSDVIVLEDEAEAAATTDLIEPRFPLERYREQSEVLEIDVQTADSPRLLRQLSLDGRFLSARLVAGGLRVAMQHSSVVPVVYPWAFPHWVSAEAIERYNEALRELFRLGQWMPLYGLQDYTDNSFSHGYALDCTRTYAPAEQLPTGWGGLPSTGFMLSFDLSGGISEWGSAAVIGMAHEPTVYASADSLYLAAPHNSWRDTAIHRFDISDPLAPTYFGGGVVKGKLLSQWSLSEHDGYLRVATTNRDEWPTVSSVTVLEAVPDDPEGETLMGSLEEVGQVSGLGVRESIFAVRFAGDVGYVVTFRQIDPLYVLDLSDPTDPKEVGELKIPGFSRYLHPLSGGLLLGIGRDADPNTGRELGLQASLFDVSDPTNPTQLAVLPFGEDAFSPVESDHRAFRFQDGLAWIPVGPNDWYLRQDHDGAFLGVRVNEDGLTHEATLRVHGEAMRAVPLDAQIHLLGSGEVRTYQLDDYTDQGALSFADEWDNRWLPPSPPE